MTANALLLFCLFDLFFIGYLVWRAGKWRRQTIARRLLGAARAHLKKGRNPTYVAAELQMSAKSLGVVDEIQEEWDGEFEECSTITVDPADESLERDNALRLYAKMQIEHDGFFGDMNRTAFVGGWLAHFRGVDQCKGAIGYLKALHLSADGIMLMSTWTSGYKARKYFVQASKDPEPDSATQPYMN